MKATQLLDIINEIILLKGDIEINIQSSPDDDSKMIEGVKYFGDGEDIKVSLTPIE